MDLSSPLESPFLTPKPLRNQMSATPAIALAIPATTLVPAGFVYQVLFTQNIASPS